jgi:hypothetical protein
MTEEEYYAAVKRFGLRPKTSETYLTIRGEPQSVPLASDQTPAQRRETIEWIKQCLGIGTRRED